MGSGYIDIKKLRKFNKNTTIQKIVNELDDVYEIQNMSDEGIFYIAEALYEDLQMERANYKAYIKKGMDARFMMELRKTAILPLVGDALVVFERHSDCETVEDIKNTRTRELKFINEDYDDADWQYYAITRYFLRRKSVNLEFTFEECYVDAGKYPYNDAEESRQEFLRHLGVDI